MRDVLAVIGAVCVGIWTLFLVLLALHTSREQWRRRHLARATQRPEDGWDHTIPADHAAFVEARRPGRTAFRRTLEVRRRQVPHDERAKLACWRDN